MISLTCGLKQNKTNEQTKESKTHRYREQTGSCQSGGDLEVGDMINRVKGYKFQI